MHTEEEAKTKWCPMAHRSPFSSLKDGPVNASDTTEYAEEMAALHPCIGSACMAWAWVPQTYDRKAELWSRSKNCRVNAAWGDDAWWRPVGSQANDEPPVQVGFCTIMGDRP